MSDQNDMNGDVLDIARLHRAIDAELTATTQEDK